MCRIFNRLHSDRMSGVAGFSGPPGNNNGAKGRRWADAIDRALARRCKSEGIAELDRLAEAFLDTVEAMAVPTPKRGPDIAGFKELADRLDGKAAQSVLVGADSDYPIPPLVIIGADKK